MFSLFSSGAPRESSNNAEQERPSQRDVDIRQSRRGIERVLRHAERSEDRAA